MLLTEQDIPWLMEDTEDLIDVRTPHVQEGKTVIGAKKFIHDWREGKLGEVSNEYVLKTIARFNDYIEHRIRQ